ncbi:hypothetical protein BDV96DRAFT_177380 [Lophiotrema nucula]|uniref:Protein kinase domain-containing protein n=1 Tax=Lophiotrema nucula TaxID=690887 RepID=A0A6A5YX48_9PLEO|nr:hypothetical protein BDV96DRAFT_177380 [Lophiotrema nucula]
MAATALRSTAPAVKTAASATELFVGQTLRGRSGTYSLTKQLHPFVWKARNDLNENVIVKSRRHWTLQHERDITKYFQKRTPTLRPLIDEVVTPNDPPAIVFRYLETDALTVCHQGRLPRKEVKAIAKTVLEALRTLHARGVVHSGTSFQTFSP